MLIAIIKIIKISPIAEVLFSKFVQQQKKNFLIMHFYSSVFFFYVLDLCVSWHQKLFEKHPFIENADPILGDPHSWAI